MKLSILTCHLPDRRQVLARLMRRLVPQCVSYGECLNWDEILTILLYEQELEFGDQVEWLIDSTDRVIDDGNAEGGKRRVSIGEKRNALLARSHGKMVQFLDDDDLVSTWMVQRVLKAMETDPDVIGFWGVMRPRSSFSSFKEGTKFVHSLEYKEWRQNDGIYERHSNHLNPVRRELALQAGYPLICHGEDFEYSKRLLPLLKTEVMVGSREEPMYEYYA